MSAGRPEPTFVSTGRLPPPEAVGALVVEAHERFGEVDEGANSDVCPALGRVPSDLFGVCVVGTNGHVYEAGDAHVEFTIMSVAKPFVFALVCQHSGSAEVRAQIGVNATGRPFNLLEAIQQSRDGRTNPMVNSGPIATTSLVPGADVEERWEIIRDGLSRFAGRALSLDDEVYRSASETNERNRNIARLLAGLNRVYTDPVEAVEL